jgi:hypothetical protein
MTLGSLFTVVALAVSAIMTGVVAKTIADIQGSEHRFLVHRGFVVNAAVEVPPDGVGALSDALRMQIDIVDQATAKRDTHTFFQSVSIVIGSRGAVYHPRADFIELPVSFKADRNPILLHEMMHAYHDQRLPSGNRNPDVERLYRQARDGELFPAESKVLESAAEYFAMVGSVYLHGKAGREPFSRANLRVSQPEAYAWLEREFGPR